MLFLVALFLCLWFWRRNLKDANIWMLATYAGVAVMAWSDYSTVSAAGGAMNEALPRIVRDFLLLGMVGFVQSLAVNKRMPIWMAVVLTLVIFALAHFLEFEKPGGDSVILTEQTSTEQIEASKLDPSGELLVQVAHGDKSLEAMALQMGWSAEPAFNPESADATELDDYYILDVNDVAKAEGALSRQSFVLYFEPNELIQVDPLVADGAEASKKNPSLSINDPETGQQWVMEVMNMEAYYQLLARQTAVKKAKIAILDTGVDGKHEDLKDNYFSIETKYDNDPMGHGTHCAGIAAGVTNNNIGIGSLAGAGAQPFVEVTSIKVLSAGGMGTQKTIIAGIIEAADEGADVISLSLGGPSNSSRQKAYSQAVKYAINQGAIVVSAAGNSNRDAKDYAPANSTNMITVSAIDENLNRAVFSNTVNNVKQGIAAPGVAIYSTTPDNNYKVFSGTSMATPFVAGLLGVMRSVNPDLSAADAYKILKKTGVDSKDSRLTGKVVQPEAALKAALK
ncbi:S8 family serine peptidase [Neolewinella aurantiaca]|uniref:S8 family serine peptidase n=1 Tax=Neolewinella aurantiaca TaxID=2602767 RepID=A0A5C7FJW2_9BACT|nr:S8 family serine peptidase [Neolewinella aurantiaca]TXF85706.1 S8 family serine peptidase [Neolewinella aurantiaca]